MVDKDGKFSYSNVIVLKIGEKQSLNVYPNPASNIIHVQITSSDYVNTKSDIQIVDYLGRNVYENKVNTILGSQTLDINISHLTKGNYVLMLKNDTDIKIAKFIKD